MPGAGNSAPPTSLRVPITTSAGLFNLANLASLKKSDLNSTRSTERMSYPDSVNAFARVSMASGSLGGVTDHAGTWASSATKKLYRCRATNLAVAGCSQMILMMSSPLKRPVCPRKVFSVSSWSSSLYSKNQGNRPIGNLGSGGCMVQPVKALEHSLTSTSV